MYSGVKTWNPLAGFCQHECLYCSTISLRSRYQACAAKYSGEYRIYEHEMKNLGKNKEIFVCAQNDLFEATVPAEIIHRILKHTRNADKSNLFMFQTKNPARFHEFLDEIPENCMLGTTIETDRRDLINEFSNAPAPYSRSSAMMNVTGFKKYITIEPSMECNLNILYCLVQRAKPDKVFIGADSKGHGLPEPAAFKIHIMIDLLGKITEVEIKDNLHRLINNGGKT